MFYLRLLSVTDSATIGKLYILRGGRLNSLLINWNDCAHPVSSSFFCFFKVQGGKLWGCLFEAIFYGRLY